MRPDWRAVPVVAALLLAGALGAGLYAALLEPFYAVAVSTLSERAGWQVVSVEVRTAGWLDCDRHQISCELKDGNVSHG